MKKIITKIAQYKGKPAIFINGKATPPQYYALTDCPNGNKSYETIPQKCIKQFSDIGFHLFQADVWLEDMMTESGKLDVSFAQKQIKGFSSVCPDAAVMLRLHLNPPSWWLNSHPEECTRFCNADIKPIPRKPAHERYLEFDLSNFYRVSYASKKWLCEYSEILREFLREIKKTEEWNNLSAIQVANGIYGENHYWGFTKYDPDVSEPMLFYFREYLQNKYKNISALRSAWNDDSVTFDSVILPGVERYKTSAGILRNPEKEKHISDYYEAQHRAVAESVDLFCGIIKKDAPELITGAFYGYYLSLFDRQAAGGHLCEDFVLNSENVDFLCAPQAYGRANREIGGPGLSRGLIESVILHGKLWLSEMDQPSHFGTLLGGMITYGKEDSIQNNRKCVVEPFLRGGGMWYYDFGKYYCAGWWDDDDFLSDILRVKNIYDKYFEKELGKAADVLLVLDTKTFFYTAINSEGDPITDSQMNLCVIDSFRSGASVSCIYLSDIEKVDLSQYKCVYFVNCWCTSDNQLKFIREKVCADGRSVIFAGNFAATDGQKLDYRRTSGAVGIKLEAEERIILPNVNYKGALSDAGGSSDMYLNNRKREYGKTVFMTVSDENAVPVGTFDDGAVSAAYVKRPDCTVWYTSLIMSNPTTLRELYRMCGCHIYDENCDAVLAGQGLIEVHTRDGGERTVTLKNGKKITFTLSPSETALFDSETGERVL